MPAESGRILTDTHCHLDLPQFDADRSSVIQRAVQAGVRRMLIPALNISSSLAVTQLAETAPMLFAAIGVHPNEALSWDGESLARLRALAGGGSKVAAVGEIGLDYYWDSAPARVQQSVLWEQLKLADELDLPVVIHLREKDDAPQGDCAADLLRLLEDWVAGLRAEHRARAAHPGVLHSFSGSDETARQAIQLGFYIGVTGPVTYKNAGEKRKVIGGLPLERLLIETDAPFLAPVPRRGRRNEPAFVLHIADKIAEIQSRTPQEVAERTTRNAAQLFSWGDLVE